VVDAGKTGDVANELVQQGGPDQVDLLADGYFSQHRFLGGHR